VTQKGPEEVWIAGALALVPVGRIIKGEPFSSFDAE
jgi:hypothetical protein